MKRRKRREKKRKGEEREEEERERMRRRGERGRRGEEGEKQNSTEGHRRENLMMTITIMMMMIMMMMMVMALRPTWPLEGEDVSLTLGGALRRVGLRAAAGPSVTLALRRHWILRG